MFCNLFWKFHVIKIRAVQVFSIINNTTLLLYYYSTIINIHIFAYIFSYFLIMHHFSCSVVSHFATPWTTARQASLSIPNSWSPPKLKSIEMVMPSSHLILCRPLLLPSIFLSIMLFSSESALCISWPKYWSFSFNISPSNEHPVLIFLGWTCWISLQSKGLSRLFSNTTVQKHQCSGTQLSL